MTLPRPQSASTAPSRRRCNRTSCPRAFTAKSRYAYWDRSHNGLPLRRTCQGRALAHSPASRVDGALGSSLLEAHLSGMVSIPLRCSR